MNLLPNLKIGERLGGGFALVLLLLGVITLVALLQTRQADTQLAYLENTTLPAVKRVHELAALVDDLRGLSALHLLHRGDAEQDMIEAQMAADRNKLTQGLAAYGKQVPVAGADRQLYEAVKASMATFWATLDRLILASRQSARDPGAGEQARALLSGESQRAFQQLSADLDALWVHHEEQAEKVAKAAHAEARNSTVLVLCAATLVGVLGLGLGVLLRRLSQRLRQSTPDLTPKMSDFHADIGAGADDVVSGPNWIARSPAGLSGRKVMPTASAPPNAVAELLQVASAPQAGDDTGAI